MRNSSLPQEQVYWFLHHTINPQPLRESSSCDVAIIGGGMAGLMAAHAFRSRGLSVVVLEKNFCGSGASGLSSGFITPNSELGLSHYVRVFGEHKAKALWNFVRSGGDLIDELIKQHTISCDYIKEDTLIVANNLAGFGDLYEEHADFKDLGFESSLYFKDDVPKLIGSTQFEGAMRFGGTFGINCFQYLQSLKEILQSQGVRIYEESQVTDIEAHTIKTTHGSIKADYVVVCVDRWMPSLNVLPNKIFQVQTFVMASEILDEKTVRKIFPDKRYMMWDTDLVYQYYRMTGDNRFIIGGSTMWKSYQHATSCHPRSVFKKLTRYMEEKFPQVSLKFEYLWPGMIGITKDLTALAGRDLTYPNRYYVSGVTGLPWAAALGTYAAEHLIDGRTDLDELFSPQRTFPLPDAFHYPLVKVNLAPSGSLYAKLEYLNPGGSVKDRSALYMIEQAERNGTLKPGGTIIDASSGNQGIASAMLGAIKGYKVIITVSDKISDEKLNAVKAYGAQVVMCPSTSFIDDPDNYHQTALALHKKTPNSFMPNQYFNPENARAHYTLLGPEIWEQTHGKITHFFAAAGTCGTISGVGRYLKEKNPAVKVFAVDSDKSFRSTNGNPQPYKVEGMGIDWNNSPVLDESVIDDYLPISDEHALGMLKTLARNHGILAGPSSGAVAYAAQEYSKKLDSNSLAVMIFGDSGRAYLTKNFY